MTNTNRNILISCGMLLGIVCLCLVVAGLLSLGGSLTQRTIGANQPTPTRPVITPFPTSVAAQQPDETSVPQPTAVLEPAIAAQLDEIEGQVIELRGLTPIHAVPRTILTRDELRQRLEDEIFKDYTAEDAADDAQVLSLLGLTPPEFDLYSFYLDLYTEQIAGYYDDDTKSMYVIQDEEFTILQRMTYAHEFTHALQDMYYGFEEGMGYGDEACEQETERCRGVQAVIEGDASFTEQLWLGNYTTEADQLELQTAATEMESPVYDAAPLFFQEDLTFPYFSGLEFIASRVDEAGFAAIDQAFREPPVTSEQVLHPELYQVDEPQAVELPDLTSALGDGWRLVDKDSLGEWYVYLLLTTGYDPAFRLTETAAREAAAGWDGDAYAVFNREDDGAQVLVVSTLWDSPEDAVAFQNAMSEYVRLRWGVEPQPAGEGQLSFTTPVGPGMLKQQDTSVLWLMAPDAVILEDLQSELP